MNIIISLILNLWILLVGTPTAKNSLRKKPTKESFKIRLDAWIQRNFYIICLVTIVFLLITFVFVCFMICGVSATESGLQYNHLQDVI